MVMQIIKSYCFYEGGVRELKRQISKISRKYVNQLLTDFLT
jgi:ATP-dependent Lon protease